MTAYISEVDYDGGAGSNFVEVVVSAGTDVTAYSLVIYDNDGTVIETFSFGSPSQTISGKHVFLFDDTDPNWVDIHNNEAIALVDDTGTVVQFIAFKDPVTAVEGPADGFSATQIGEHSGGDESLVSSDGGASYSPTPTATAGTITCYARGTLIDTLEGPKAVEDIKRGDLVQTVDAGACEVLYTRHSTQWLDPSEGSGYPILISAGALGAGRPNRDLVVSPQHRILVGCKDQLAGIFADESFVPAKALVSLPGIREMRGKTHVTWLHFAFRTHEIVTANGCLSESLLLGPMVTNRLTAWEKHKLSEIFGRPGEPCWNGPLARRCIKCRDARRTIDWWKTLGKSAA